MKIIHCADLHLDSKMTSNLSKEQAKERKNEILHTFSRMVDYAKEQAVRVILIAGDLFDTRNVSATARNLVRDTITANPEIDFLYLKGNHDTDNFLSNLENVPANLKLFSNQWTSYQYGKIKITGLELNPDNYQSAYHALALNHDEYNIVTLHGQEAGYKTKDQAEVISLNELKNKNIDYLALGHVHGFQEEQLDARGVYCYPGCLEGRGFDECGKKGFVLIDIDEEKLLAKREFVSLSARTLYTVPVDVSDCLTTEDAGKVIETVIAKAGSSEENSIADHETELEISKVEKTDDMEKMNFTQNDLIKFVLKGNVAIDSEFNTDYLTDRFRKQFYFVKIYDQTQIRVDYKEYEKDASLKGEFIRLVSQGELDEETRTEIIRYGIAVLSGEDI